MFKQFSGAGELTQELDLNYIYVTTSITHRLVKLSHTGNIIKIVGQLGKGNAELNLPNRLRMSNRHELYVCDCRNNRVQVFDLDLNFMRSFEKKGAGKGQFNSPADVDFDSGGNIYVTELDNNRIQVFTPAEWHIRIIIPGNQFSFGVSEFRPVSLLMHNENIYVTDANNHGNGFLRRPEGIIIDRAGFIYVTSDHFKIVKF